MSYPTALKQYYNNVNIKTIDLREDSFAEEKTNYLETKLNYKPDIIITNPPFNIARDIIEKALGDVSDNGYVVMLLRLNYFGGQVRKDMWDKQLPEYAFIHNKRMGFTDDGKRDSVEYMHCVWKKNCFPNFIKTKII